MDRPTISVISPVYGCEVCLRELVARIFATTESIGVTAEVLLVNDDSPDRAWEVIQDLANRDSRIRGFRLSRNFGQHAAIFAGMHLFRGEWVVIMDCDLQDRPEEIAPLYRKALEGWEIVQGRREFRRDGLLKRLSSKAFYAVLGYLTQTRQEPAIGNFGIYNSRTINAITEMGDGMRYFPSTIQWVGFKRTSVPVRHDERKEGKTSYSLRRLVGLALNVMLGFSDKPLKLAVRYGLILSAMAMVFAVVILYRYFVGGITVSGWASMIISIWFLTGNVILVLGIVGLYIGQIFERVKMRPPYIVAEDTDAA
ncbi:glycosyltransferase family 2 protein [bacterium]|nr:glycosyltransferase family 2 protein [bacterium]